MPDLLIRLEAEQEVDRMKYNVHIANGHIWAAKPIHRRMNDRAREITELKKTEQD